MHGRPSWRRPGIKVDPAERDRTKKVRLERILQSLDALPQPRPEAEQYATPAPIAAEVLFIAHGKGDIAGRSVVDLGCGTGVLAIGAALLAAERVVGIDSDAAAIDLARRNAVRAGVELDWRLGDVRTVRGSFDTVLMNPPFGAQTAHADRPFLETALASGHVLYTFMNAASEDFVRQVLASGGGRITDRLEYSFPIPRTFSFHRDEVRRHPVVLVRVEVAKG